MPSPRPWKTFGSRRAGARWVRAAGGRRAGGRGPRRGSAAGRGDVGGGRRLGAVAGLTAALVSLAVTAVSGLIVALLFFSELQYYLTKEVSIGDGWGPSPGGEAARGGLPCLRTPSRPPPPPDCLGSSFPHRRATGGPRLPLPGRLGAGSRLLSPASCWREGACGLLSAVARGWPGVSAGCLRRVPAGNAQQREKTPRDPPPTPSPKIPESSPPS